MVVRARGERSIALFRIVFAALALANVAGLWNHADLLFGHDGMFTGADAGRVFAPEVFSDDASAPARAAAAIRGPFSLLYVDGALALDLHVVVFVLGMTALMVGLCTRVAAVLALTCP